MYYKFELEAVKTTFYGNSNEILTRDNVHPRMQHKAFNSGFIFLHTLFQFDLAIAPI